MATSSTIFFRSIGSTVGVAAFGSVIEAGQSRANRLSLASIGLGRYRRHPCIAPFILLQAGAQRPSVVVNSATALKRERAPSSAAGMPAHLGTCVPIQAEAVGDRKNGDDRHHPKGEVKVPDRRH